MIRLPGHVFTCEKHCLTNRVPTIWDAEGNLLDGFEAVGWCNGKSLAWARDSKYHGVMVFSKEHGEIWGHGTMTSVNRLC